MDFDLSIDHPLQREMFKRLTYADILRFSDLRPERTETNLCNYHIKQLIKSKLVHKVEGGYSLSPQGKALADKLSYKNFRFRVQPKIVTILAIERADGAWLMYERLHQPYIHKLGFPSGKIHYGEQRVRALSRELREKTNIDVHMEFRGNVYIITEEKGTTLSHILGHVFYGQVPNTCTTEHASRDGKTFWADWRSLNYDEFIPGYKELQELLKTGQRFAEEYTFQLS